MQNEKVRLFIALDLPTINDQNRPIQFANTQLLISQAIEDFRPVNHFHLTLLFIGSVPLEQVPKIKDIIHQAIKQFIDEYKEGLSNGIGGFMMMPGAAIMGKNAVAMKLVDNYLVSALIALLVTSFEENDLMHDKHAGESLLNVTLGRVGQESKKQEDIKRFLELLPAPIGGRAQLKETFTAQSVTLYKSMPNSEYIPLATYLI